MLACRDGQLELVKYLFTKHDATVLRCLLFEMLIFALFTAQRPRQAQAHVTHSRGDERSGTCGVLSTASGR